MRMRRILTVFILLIIGMNSYASGYKSFSGEVSPKGAALGNSGFLNFHSDVVLHWNPAAMLTVDHRQFSFYTSRLFRDNNQYYVDYISRGKGSSAFGFAAFVNTISDIELREIPSPEPTGVTSSDDLYLLFAYAKELKNGTLAGASIKYMYTSLLGYSASGMGMDISVIKYLNSQLSVSAGIRNLGFSSKWLNATIDLPQELLIGINRNRLLAGNGYSFNVRLLSRLVLLEPKNSWINSLGLEYQWKEIINLNVGYSAGTDAYKYSGGVDIHYLKFSVSYAFRIGEAGLNNAQYIGLKMIF
jgi:hypothetical protein